MAVKIFLTLFSVLIFSVHTFAQAIGRSDHFTFKQGVTLNHWTNMPIEGWTYADPKWFSEKDVEWIARQGIDHVQFYVSVREVFKPDDTFDLTKLAAVDSAVEWCRKAGLGVILTFTSTPLPEFADLQAEFWGKFAEHFKSQGANVRFLVGYPVDGEIAARNMYFEKAVASIRRSDAKRMIYLTAATTDRIAELYVPKNDRNIGIAARMAQWQLPEAIDVFLLQHSFSKRPLLIAFPTTLPNLEGKMADDDKWAVKFSNVRLNEKYLDAKFRKVNEWMKRNQPGREFYLSHWRYVTGWPFAPESVKDERSIRNFGKAFSRTTRRNKINWSIYDYNSGSPIRYPNGEEALILKALRLRPKRK